MKILLIAVLLFLTFCDPSTSIFIDCEYGVYDFLLLGSTYHCEVNQNPQIFSKESTDVNIITGTHLDSKKDTDVALFYAYEKTIKYFPQGLEKFFTNLKGIYISDCGLKKIHQSDLKPFPDLNFLTIKYNEIEVLEEGLFNFNPKLKTLVFYEKNIIHIDPNVFDELPNLVNFWFSKVPCIERDIDDNRADVEKAIESAKTKCVNPDFKALAEEFKTLETDLSQEKPKNANEKFKNFDNSFKKSKFVEFRPLSYKVADLKLKYNLTSEDSNPDITEKFSGLPDIPSFLTDIKSSQDVFKNSFAELANLQNAQQAALSGFASSFQQPCIKVDDQFGNGIMELSATIEGLGMSFNATADALQKIMVAQETLKSSQDAFKSSVDAVKSSQDNLQSSIGEVKITLGDLEKSQTEFKANLMEIKNSQNEIKNSISSNKNEDKLAKVDEKFGKFDEKLVKIEKNFADLKAENAGKFEKIEKELSKTKDEIAANFDKKLKEVEAELVKKFEEILVEKLRKFLS